MIMCSFLSWYFVDLIRYRLLECELFGFGLLILFLGVVFVEGLDNRIGAVVIFVKVWRRDS